MWSDVTPRKRSKRWTPRVARKLGYPALLLVLLAAFDGPLFPWSPVKSGYSHMALSRADVYYPSGAALDPAYRQIDHFIGEAEDFHGLKMPERITVIAARSWMDFHLQMPAIRGNAVGAVTLQTGTVIWVTPKLAEKHLDVAEFIRHELSHAILEQNTTLWRGFKMNRQPWFYEGIAVSFGRQQSYLSHGEFVEQARSHAMLPVFEGSSGDMRFNYPAWRYFLEYLKHSRGPAAFQSFMLDDMREPDHWPASFQKDFGVPFAAAVSEFEAKVREGKAP
jgi:hypothetical protein